MDDTNNTVVYRHRKPCGEVFYVGIGNKQRPYSNSDRNKFWHNVVNKWGYEVEVVANCLNWAAACELEELMILAYGRRDLGTGTLVNMTDGGEGAKGLVHSTKTKQKMSAAKSGKKLSEETKKKMSAAAQNMSAEHRQKIGAANTGKKHTEETKQKMSAASQKLTFKQAEEIRLRYQTEKTSHRKLGQEYSVGKSTISRIIRNERYTKHN